MVFTAEQLNSTAGMRYRTALRLVFRHRQAAKTSPNNAAMFRRLALTAIRSARRYRNEMGDA